MKELPATALLRPLGGDTLAIAVWEATKDSRFDTAALPALLIVALGLVPVIVLVRLARTGVLVGGEIGRSGRSPKSSVTFPGSPCLGDRRSSDLPAYYPGRVPR